jgi:hypothetical protein
VEAIVGRWGHHQLWPEIDSRAFLKNDLFSCLAFLEIHLCLRICLKHDCPSQIIETVRLPMTLVRSFQ